MLLVAAIGVMFSTFLAGPVALLATLSVVLIGQFRNFIEGLFDAQLTGDNFEVPGGGPIESLYRIVTQASIVVGTGSNAFCNGYENSGHILAGSDAAGSIVVSFFCLDLGTSNFVASGFDIPMNLIGQHAFETIGYLLAFFIAGAFILKAREVAS